MNNRTLWSEKKTYHRKNNIFYFHVLQQHPPTTSCMESPGLRQNYKQLSCSWSGRTLSRGQYCDGQWNNLLIDDWINVLGNESCDEVFWRRDIFFLRCRGRNGRNSRLDHCWDVCVVVVRGRGGHSLFHSQSLRGSTLISDPQGSCPPKVRIRHAIYLETTIHHHESEKYNHTRDMPKFVEKICIFVQSNAAFVC